MTARQQAMKTSLLALTSSWGGLRWLPLMMIE